MRLPSPIIWALTDLVVIISAAWGVLAFQPYWVLVCVMVLAALCLVMERAYYPTARSIMSTMAVPFLLVPILSIILVDGGVTSFLVYAGGSVALFMSALVTIAPRVIAVGYRRRAALAGLSFFFAVSASCLALLFLYYLDAFLSSSALRTNLDLMLPLTYATVGSAMMSAYVFASEIDPVPESSPGGV
jgi:hypothetical protein